MVNNLFSRKSGLVLVLFCGAILCFLLWPGSPFHAMKTKILGRRTLEGVLAELSLASPETVRAWQKWDHALLVALKEERQLWLYAREEGGGWQYIKNYPFTGFSGVLGPKTKEGDRQIPEGLYQVVSLNPNSRFHLSIELDYPNEFDRRMGRVDGRSSLGGDIFIHGGEATVGCIPIGDIPIEDLYLRIGLLGVEQVKVVMAPHDFRKKPFPEIQNPPDWLETKYDRIYQAMRHLPDPASNP